MSLSFFFCIQTPLALNKVEKGEKVVLLVEKEEKQI